MTKLNKTILVAGGAGYIGSHMVSLLIEQGYSVVVIDDLSTGHKDAVSSAEFIEGNIGDSELLDSVFARFKIDGVIDFAASIQVGESVEDPASYYRNNFINTVGLLDCMIKHDVKNFIFSSTAAVFGEPQYLPVDEEHPKLQLNPYGRTKWMVEQVLQDYNSAYGLKSVALRYFNAAGADPAGRLGPRYPKLTHLILLVLEVARGVSDHLEIFGDDYDTTDGTCVRDFVHVSDLCTAHLLALERLLKGEETSPAYNLGSGQGYSVKQVIETARKVTGHAIPVEIKGRREGDPAMLVANSLLAQKELGWEPKYMDLEVLLGHTWKFVNV